LVLGAEGTPMKRVKNFIKNNILLVTNIIIIVIGAIFAIVLSVNSLKSIIKKDMENTTSALFDGVYTSISDVLEYTVNYTNGMCNDYFLQEMLDLEDEMDEAEFEDMMAKYLERNRAANNWEGAYLISCKTNKYYTPDGVGKIVDPENNEYDVWYKNFIESGMEYGSDLTYDEFNDQEYVIFTDRVMRINGEVRAVLGCAIYLTDITDDMKHCADEYNVDVCLTDVDGNTTLDINGINLVESYYSRYYTNDMVERDQIYTDDGYIIRRYIPNLGMYLVVRNNHYSLSEKFIKIFRGAVIYAFVMILILTCLNFYRFRGEKAVLKSNIYTDFLTQISNVKGLQTNIKTFISGGNSKEIGGSMFILDIDNFKQINDNFGHRKGDEVLHMFANELSKAFRAGDIVGRLGGDEFMVFSPTLNEYDHIENKAQELKELFQWTISEAGKAVNISVSIGVAIYPKDGATYEELYKTADKALYYVKEHKKDGYCIYGKIS